MTDLTPIDVSTLKPNQRIQNASGDIYEVQSWNSGNKRVLCRGDNTYEWFDHDELFEVEASDD